MDNSQYRVDEENYVGSVTFYIDPRTTDSLPAPKAFRNSDLLGIIQIYSVLDYFKLKRIVRLIIIS